MSTPASGQAECRRGVWPDVARDSPTQSEHREDTANPGVCRFRGLGLIAGGFAGRATPSRNLKPGIRVGIRVGIGFWLDSLTQNGEP
jgi:hypothetical protein